MKYSLTDKIRIIKNISSNFDFLTKKTEKEITDKNYIDIFDLYYNSSYEEYLNKMFLKDTSLAFSYYNNINKMIKKEIDFLNIKQIK